MSESEAQMEVRLLEGRLLDALTRRVARMLAVSSQEGYKPHMSEYAERLYREAVSPEAVRE